MSHGTIDKYIELNDYSIDVQSLSMKQDVRVCELEHKSCNKWYHLNLNESFAVNLDLRIT